MSPPAHEKASGVYYGWIIVATLAFTETIAWGIVHYAFSVFIAPMEAELGWSRAQLMGAFSLSLLVRGAMAFPVGYWVDRYGARWLMTVAAGGASLLVMAWSQNEVSYLISADDKPSTKR